VVSAPPAHVAPSSPSAVPAPPALDSGWSWVETVGTPRQEREGATPAKKLAFRGSGFTWGHAATTSLLGVGTDYISTSHQIYEQSYTLLLNYFAYEGDKIDLRLVTTPGMDVELTNSDVTTTYREPLFRD